MRAAVIIIVLIGIALFFGNMLMTTALFADQGHLLATAYGGAMGDTIQMHLGIPPRMVMRDPPMQNDEGRMETWRDWIERHFDLRDASNEQLRLQKMGTSGLLVGAKVAGAPEFALVAELKKGESYTFDIAPVVSEGKRYRFSFTAPTEEKKAGRSHFQLVTPK